MQTHIYIDNYRGFSDAAIPISQVNFLVGENSTGKTSFLELIEIFSNVSFWLLEPSYGLPGAQVKHFLDLVSAASKNKNSFTVGAIGCSKQKPEHDAQDCGMLVSYKNEEGRAIPSRVSIIQGRIVKTIDGRLIRPKKSEKYKVREKTYADFNGNSIELIKKIAADHKIDTGFKKYSQIIENPAPLFMKFEHFLFNGMDYRDHPHEAPFPFMNNHVELAPIRTRPKRTYDAPQTTFSPEGEHTPYIIKKRLSNRSQAEAFKTFLENAGENSGLFKTISIKPYGRGPLAPFEIQIILGCSALSLENVGYGVSQALPLLVEMFVRSDRTAFALQQPEVHLHPRAQATFGDIIAELARSDSKRFFVETHSDFTIDRFRLNIRQNGSLQAQLLFFERTTEGNKATSIPISKNGDFPENQPDAYRDFFFNESLALLM